ncbi:uncharacterized protein LOC115704339 [Cannabis sativa]|uniref:uncharacterized protein LOC115704339 n=1 Tax=Cannabis sativa TaxID=3483 RepID=UPI0029CA7AAE|nr:uncharacterized protein LOC115704339 [Cannabis sativa]
MEKIRLCGQNLETWGKNLTGSFKKRIGFWKKKIAQFKGSHDADDISAYNEAEKQLFEIYAQREVFWRQRSKQLWLRDGDNNSRYFHTSATTRQKNNAITKLQGPNGVWCDWNSGLNHVIQSYFEELFCSSNVHLAGVVDNIRPSLTAQQNVDLLASVTEEEVKAALFQMHPEKSPGPDGMTPGFFQKCWSIVKKDVVALVMANRLKAVLPQLISDTQSAFVPGRYMTDNIVISYEVMHYLKQKRMGKEGYMALKLDFSKAYDRVEWQFLEAVLQRMGFDSKWIHLVMSCISSVEYMLIKHYEVSHQIRGIRVANGAPFIFHMLFADDSYIFCRANGNDSTNASVCSSICQSMGIQEAGENSSYLGLPCTSGRNKNVVFGFLKDKASKRIMSWEGKFLSKAGKELLLKTVAQALPNHAMHKHKGGLGFKDLRQYNIALLGKQAWRLLVHDSTLVSKVFKARYFPNGSFLSASLGNNPSYVWRSIFEAKDLIMAGARRSIASGIQTLILGDPWLPDVEDPYVHSIHPGLVNQTVASLMCVQSKQWDKEIIEDLFDTRDRNLIFSILLFETVQTDCWSWSKDCTGLYSVKSAYGWLQNQSNVPGLDTGFWKVFWKIKVQPKVLQFAWRALTDTLAMKVQLTTKHVYVNKLCIFCNMAEETIIHVLNNSKEQIEEALMVSWAIWNARNNLMWNQKNTTAAEVVLSARTHLYQWQNAQQTKGEPPLSHFEVGREVEHWTKPTESMVKVNVDGATFEATNAFGYGFISRDTNGAIIEARCSSKSGNSSPETVEVLGIKEALSWIKGKTWSKVVIESDCLVAVQAIHTKVVLPSLFGMLVQDCQYLLSQLSHVQLCFVKRSANKVAHFLARSSCYLSDRSFFKNNSPSELLKIVEELVSLNKRKVFGRRLIKVLLWEERELSANPYLRLSRFRPDQPLGSKPPRWDPYRVGKSTTTQATRSHTTTPVSNLLLQIGAKLVKAFRNIPGADIVKIERLTLLKHVPNSRLRRFVI